MKKIQFLSHAIIALFCITSVSAQSAEEVIAKYLNTIGGKDQVNKVSSVYMEGTIDAMGNQGAFKATLLNGKGFKEEVDLMGNLITMCYTDSMGWQINPMTGNTMAEKMTEPQYQSGKEQIYAGGLFVTDFLGKGYKIELAGQENVGTVSAHKIKVISPENAESFYFFDPESGYLIKLVQKGDMMGQSVDIIITYSNYQQPENGFIMPHTLETNYGGQFFLTAKVNKVEVNQPVDPAIFVKP
jgi:hypothetical protein